MKKFFLLCFSLIVSCFLFQCDDLKNETEPQPNSNLILKGATTPNLPSSNVRDSKLTAVYDYSKTKNYVTKKGNNVTVTPIYYENGETRYNFHESKTPTQLQESHDFLVVDKNNKKNTSLIFSYIPLKATKKNELSFKNFTGSLFIKNSKNEFIEGGTFKNGKQETFIVAKNRNAKVNECQPMFLNSYEKTCYENGYCTEWQLVGSEYLGLNCDGAGQESDSPVNEGGGGGNNNNNQAACNANLEAIANSTSPSDQTISEVIIGSSVGLVEKKYVWNALNGPTWHVESTENTTINTTTNMFESLTHEKAEIIGFALLTSLTSNSITCNPQGPSDYKHITLYFTISYGANYEGFSCSINRSYTQGKILYPNL